MALLPLEGARRLLTQSFIDLPVPKTQAGIASHCCRISEVLRGKDIRGAIYLIIKIQFTGITTNHSNTRTPVLITGLASLTLLRTPTL